MELATAVKWSAFFYILCSIVLLVGGLVVLEMGLREADFKMEIKEVGVARSVRLEDDAGGDPAPEQPTPAPDQSTGSTIKRLTMNYENRILRIMAIALVIEGGVALGFSITLLIGANKKKHSYVQAFYLWAILWCLFNGFWAIGSFATADYYVGAICIIFIAFTSFNLHYHIRPFMNSLKTI